MKHFPKLAIVGRPNVGKSALFNRLCKKRMSIVDEAEGVTRDRLYAMGDFFGHPFQIIDTGGMDPFSKIDFYAEIRRQTNIAIEEADVLLFVVDGKVGVTPLDLEVSRLLFQTKKTCILAVNKIDLLEQMDAVHDFHCMGFSKIIGISSGHGINIVEMLEMAFKDVNWSLLSEDENADAIKIAVVGRPNVGKSTFVNQLLQEKRCIVSPIAGTTRDSIDTEVIIEETKYCFIDTAGIRRKRAEAEVVDKFAAIRTMESIEKADICLLMLDASEGMGEQEKRIARKMESLGKGCILLFNKWDLVKQVRMEHCLQAVRLQVPFLEYCPTLFISAHTGRNLEKIYEQIKAVYSARNKRISTGELNRFLEKAIQRYHPPMLDGGKRLRIYYAAQVEEAPPKFVFFVNKPKLMLDTYKKYLVNTFRKEFGFVGVPLHFSLKGKTDRKKKIKKVCKNKRIA